MVHRCVILAVLAVVSWCPTDASAQRGGIQSPSGGAGTVSRINWSEDGKSVSYTSEGRRYRITLATGHKTNLEDDGEPTSGDREPDRPRGRRTRRRAGQGLTGKNVGRPTRGRQYTQCNSPDGKWEAHYRDWNVVLVNASDEAEELQVTTAGNETIHYGTASWVYGEELGQRTAMWWTPDSRKLFFYKFDDTGVKPFHLVRGWSGINTTPYPEFYPKAGAKNPAAELMLYDLATKKTVRVDAGGGSEEYIFNLRASPKGDVMMVSWTDRLQHHLKVHGIDTETGACRIIVEEKQKTWQSNKPGMRFLADGHRFIWTTEKSGYTHYELRDLDGKLHHTITSGDFQCARIEFVNEEANLVGFSGYSSKKNPYFLQYHLVALDGTGQRRVTTIDSHHSSFAVSPDQKWVIARYEQVNTPPSTALYRADGKVVAHLAKSNPASAANLAEMFTFRSDDGKFDIYGILYKPSDFDAAGSYPVINALYGGPGSNEISARYVSSPRAECRRGYLVVKVNNRGTGNRGKAFLGAAYCRLGDVDIQDHADAIRHLRDRPYFDGKHVGIVGSSYGGYMAAMGIFKHPDVYAAAVNRSGVTDWRNYDTIYTERYMSTPQLNKSGYDIGRAMNKEYIANFKKAKGKILIMHGMVDDNVHPNNAFQLIDALDKASVPYESRFFPNSGHGLGRGSSSSQWEFFDRVLKPASN